MIEKDKKHIFYYLIWTLNLIIYWQRMPIIDEVAECHSGLSNTQRESSRLYYCVFSHPVAQMLFFRKIKDKGIPPRNEKAYIVLSLIL